MFEAQNGPDGARQLILTLGLGLFNPWLLGGETEFPPSFGQKHSTLDVDRGETDSVLAT